MVVQSLMPIKEHKDDLTSGRLHRRYVLGSSSASEWLSMRVSLVVMLPACVTLTLAGVVPLPSPCQGGGMGYYSREGIHCDSAARAKALALAQ